MSKKASDFVGTSHSKPATRRYAVKHKNFPLLAPCWPVSYQVAMQYEKRGDYVVTVA